MNAEGGLWAPVDLQVQTERQNQTAHLQTVRRPEKRSGPRLALPRIAQGLGVIHRAGRLEDGVVRTNQLTRTNAPPCMQRCRQHEICATIMRFVKNDRLTTFIRNFLHGRW
jgi:hypothetical protein